MKTGICKKCRAFVFLSCCDCCKAWEYTCKNCGYDVSCNCKLKEERYMKTEERTEELKLPEWEEFEDIVFEGKDGTTYWLTENSTKEFIFLFDGIDSTSSNLLSFQPATRKGYLEMCRIIRRCI